MTKGKPTMGRASTLICAVLFIYSLGCPGVVQAITAEQARQAVRDFENNQALSFDTVRYTEEDTSVTWLKDERYELKSGLNEWAVNAVTADIIRTIRDYNWPASYQANAYGSYTQPQCLAYALSFARSTYSGFDNYQFTLDRQEWTGFGWSFTWHQYVQYGAKTLNYAEVDVNPTSGAIESYIGSKVSVIQAQQPAITGPDAVELAASAGDIISVTASSSTLQVDPDGATYYRVNIDGTDSNSGEKSYLVSVNAVDGTCYDMVSPMGGPSVRMRHDAKRSVTAKAKTSKPKPTGKFQKGSAKGKLQTGKAKMAVSKVKGRATQAAPKPAQNRVRCTKTGYPRMSEPHFTDGRSGTQKDK